MLRHDCIHCFLFQPVLSDEDDSYMGDFLVSEDATPEEIAQKNAIIELVNMYLDDLKPREAYILRQRYGLNEEGKQYTLEEIGQELELTRERIRQIEAKALRKLKNPKNKGLRDLLNQ